MEKAKAAVSGFLSKDGKHDTTVHETINPAVQNEHVTKTKHENVTTAVDREVHQDHHHTSIQPIHDKEVLPEQHSHNLAGVEHRTIKHGNDDHVKQRLEAERAQFKNTREVGETQHTSAAAPSIAGEHVHHHVHETIQPVIQKETIQPSVVHTTVPIHEVHQNESKHHTASALPAVSMSEFQKQGGSLGGREERVDSFGGEPKSVGGTLGGHGAKGTTSLTEPEGYTHSKDHKSGLGHNTSGDHTGHSHTTGTTGSTPRSDLTGTNTHGSTNTTNTTHKPSLMDKLNPKIDSNGDGKAGFMK
ncbi:allergen [Phlyctema vagabunda]|uniref:Allergen n=1 Tax=Phlyctema vagabunda TaxID=108571 RepID=A0ABR4PU78_9HELO